LSSLSKTLLYPLHIGPLQVYLGPTLPKLINPQFWTQLPNLEHLLTHY
jgi:hypothetical protein